MRATGRCLCGGLKFQIDVGDGEIYQCHCSICRRATGSSANANLVVDSMNFQWLDEPATLSHYSVKEDWVSSFCSTCGSKAPCESSDKKFYYVPAGSLNEDHGLKVAKHIFVGSKAQWDIIGGNAEQRAVE